MKLSEKVFKPLGVFICGDSGLAPRLSGPELIEFFNRCGFDDEYDSGFGTRWMFPTDKIAKSNDSDILTTILEEFVDPRRHNGDSALVEKLVNNINSLIKYDGYLLEKNGEFYKIVDKGGSIIKPESINQIGHDFVNEQIKKCLRKISSNDFSGAITNARSLTEAVLIHIIETIEEVEIKNDGNLGNLWTRTKKALRIEIKKDEFPDYVYQIISGLDTSLNGLAGLSNNTADRHANKFKTKKHHAKLAVNLSMTICDFLIEILENKPDK